jgi:putative oxidoreductase
MNSKLFISRYEPQIYSLLRIVAGFLFLWHGSQKLFSLPDAGFKLPAYIVFIAGPIEFFGGLLIMTGLWTRWAAFICSGEMAFAYWKSHALHALLPLVNHGELAMLYCFLFLYILVKGSGIFSIDHYIETRS